MTRFFFPSPIASAFNLSSAEVDRLCVIYADHDVQRAAGELRYKLDRLADFAMFRSLIAQAIDTADRTGVAPIEALRRLSDEADDAMEGAHADHRAHDSAVKARNDRMRPVAMAVSEMSVKANVEREALRRHVTAAESEHVHKGVDAGRFQHLKAAGLSRDQIAGLGQPDPAVAQDKLDMLRARLAEVENVIAKCSAYFADPLRRTRHLAGLGLDNLIDQAEVPVGQLEAHA